MTSNKYLLLATCLLAVAFDSEAQKKLFTMAEATNGMATTLALQSVKQASWQPGTHRFYQVVKSNGNDYWIGIEYPKSTTDTVFSLKQLNQSLFGKDSLKSIPALSWLAKDHVYFNNANNLNKGTFNGKTWSWEQWLTLPEAADNIKVDKSGNVAYTIEQNLWMVTADKKTLEVTKETNPNILSGGQVHRREFGIEEGIFFSPKGNLLAFYQMDQTMVADYPFIDWLKTPATIRNTKYPMAGGVSHQVTLRVFSPATKETVVLQTGTPKDQYLTAVTWSPDEQSIFIAVLNREQNHMWLNQYDVKTGKLVKTLFEEQHDKYVEPQHPLTFLPDNNNEFIWWSERDGFEHLYRYNTDGKLISQLTSGNYEVNEILGFNKAAHQVIISSAKNSPLEKHLYAVDYNSGKMTALDNEVGTHTATVCEDGNFLFDVYSSAEVPKVSVIRGTKTSFKKELINASNTLAEYNRPQIRKVELKADDGTPLYGKIILPLNFDSTKKYPVVVYLYNGPHVQLVKNTFPASGNLWYEYMAQHGYIMFVMDGRGSSNRGRAFEQATFRQLGTKEMDDQLKGVAYLKSLKYVDANRMGIHGWSFGGFMTTSMMLRHPGVFKVGVAGGPVMDWSMYEIMYTERYMDTPKENPKGYADAQLYDKIKNLKGKLLLIHGTDDTTVVWQHSINFLRKAVSDGVQVDYFVYPGYEHNVRGKDRVHLMQKVTDYFDSFLK